MRPDRHRERRLGEPVGRREDVADAEALLERADRRQADRLRPRERHAEAGEVEPGRVVDVADAVAVAEVRGHGEVRPMLGDRLEPCAGAPEVGWQEHQGRAGVERAEGEADEPHVVIEREPAHEAVGGCHADRLDHHPDGGHHVPVAQHDPPGHRRAAGGVLEEADLVLGRLDRRRHGGARRPARPVSGGAGDPAPRHARPRRRRGTSRSSRRRGPRNSGRPGPSARGRAWGRAGPERPRARGSRRS